MACRLSERHLFVLIESTVELQDGAQPMSTLVRLPCFSLFDVCVLCRCSILLVSCCLPPVCPSALRPKNQERKRHININNIFPVTARVGGGVSRPGGQGSPDRWPGVKSLCAVCGTQGTQSFSSGYPAGRIGHPAGRIGDRGDREIVYVPNVYVPFPAPKEPVLSLVLIHVCCCHFP